MKLWDIKDVGLQAAARLQAAQDPLSLLTELSQNFPSAAPGLSRQRLDRKLEPKLRKAADSNGGIVPPSQAPLVLLNGVLTDPETDLYSAWRRLPLACN